MSSRRSCRCSGRRLPWGRNRAGRSTSPECGRPGCWLTPTATCRRLTTRTTSTISTSSVSGSTGSGDPVRRHRWRPVRPSRCPTSRGTTLAITSPGFWYSAAIPCSSSGISTAPAGARGSCRSRSVSRFCRSWSGWRSRRANSRASTTPSPGTSRSSPRAVTETSPSRMCSKWPPASITARTTAIRPPGPR